MAGENAEEEAELACTNLSTSIRENIGQITNGHGQDSKDLQSGIRGKLTEMRASIRLLEEFAEEQDR